MTSAADLENENARLREALRWIMARSASQSFSLKVGADVGAVLEMHWAGAPVVAPPDHLQSIFREEGWKVLDAQARKAAEPQK